MGAGSQKPGIFHSPAQLLLLREGGGAKDAGPRHSTGGLCGAPGLRARGSNLQSTPVALVTALRAGAGACGARRGARSSAQSRYIVKQAGRPSRVGRPGTDQWQLRVWESDGQEGGPRADPLGGRRDESPTPSGGAAGSLGSLLAFVPFCRKRVGSLRQYPFLYFLEISRHSFQGK